jgi:hypothetical protein
VAESAVGFDCDAMPLGRFARFLVGEVGVQLELGDGWCDAGCGNNPVEVSGLEIGDAGAAEASFGHEFCQRLPG